MNFHGVLGNPQSPRNFLVRMPAEHAAHDGVLARCELPEIRYDCRMGLRQERGMHEDVGELETTEPELPARNGAQRGRKVLCCPLSCDHAPQSRTQRL